MIKGSKTHPVFFWAPIVIISLGLIVRIIQFSFNRSFWLDEALLAVTVLDHSYRELLHPVDFVITSPPLFIWITKTLISIIGNYDWGFRILPLMAGLCSLVLFFKFLKKYASHGHILTGLTLFAFSFSLVRYSTEFKPYSSDVLWALGLLFLGLKTIEGKLTADKAITITLSGILAMWMSWSSIFILGAIGLTLLGMYVSQKRWMELNYLVPTGLVWILNFVCLYFIVLKPVGSNAELLDFWQESFMPNLFGSIRDFLWPLRSLIEIFFDPGSIKYKTFAFFVFLVGSFHLYKRNKWMLLVLILPILLTMAASGLHKYSFEGRLLLYYLPALFFLINEGMAFLLERRTYLASVLFTILAVAILAHGTLNTSKFFTRSIYREEIKPVLATLSKTIQPDDIIYVYYGAGPAFRYYRKFYDLEKYDVIWGRRLNFTQGLDDFLSDINLIKNNKRVWLLFSHIHKINKEEGRYIVKQLDVIGQRIEAINAPGAMAGLYELGH